MQTHTLIDALTNVADGGTVTPAGPTVMVEEGASKTFTFVPGEEQRIADVTVDGESKGAISEFTFSSVNGPHALVVTFAPSHHTLTFHTNGGTEVPQEKHPYNTTVPLTHETTRDNHSFTGWYADPELTERITEITLLQDAHVYAGWRYEAKPQPPKPTDPSDTPTLTTDDHFSYIAGYPDGTVRPEAEISRAEVATIFFRLLSPASRAQFWSEEANFSDVDDNAWYFNAVATMANAGVLEGYPDGTFRPNSAITRGEFAAISARFLSEPYSGPNLFSDIDGHWAATYINQAAEAGWIHGYGDDTFRPEQPISRAEAMTLINAMLGRKPHRDFLLSDARPWPDNAPDAWYYAQVQEATYSHTYQFPDGQAFEHWVELLENPDWAALEAQWRLDYARP